MSHFKIAIFAIISSILILSSLGFAKASKTTAPLEDDFFKQPTLPVRLEDKNNNKIFDDLEERLPNLLADQKEDVIIVLNLPTPDEIIRRQIGDFDIKARFPSIFGFSTNLNKEQIGALARQPFVSQVEPDLPVYPTLDQANQWFGTDKARLDFAVDGNLDGQSTYSKNDVVVAVLDTGIDPNHVDLDGGKIIGWKDVQNNQANPYDELGACSGHGTHVSSIATGEGQGNSLYKGVAPGAALVGVKVLKVQGSDCVGTTTKINQGIQWVIDNKTTFNIKIMNMSLGGGTCSSGTDSMSLLVNSAFDAGILPAVAAGNDGASGTCTIGSPGAADKALTVGAMADVNPGAASTALPSKGFYQAYFSSRGPTGDSRIKPDISAAGVKITAAQAGTTNGYQQLSGTSMATPFTAGTAALMLHKNSALTPTQLKQKIEQTAQDWGPAGKDIDYGAGRLQVYEAVKSAGGLSGNGPAMPRHQFFTDSLTGTGDQDIFNINIVNLNYPIAATLIIPDWVQTISGGCGGGAINGTPDFDIFLINPSGIQVASSEFCIRQETIGFQPTVTGTWKVRVYSFQGSGNYFFDLSAGTSSGPSISLSTDGNLNFGFAALGTTKDTTASGINDVQTVQILSGPANLDIKSTTFSDGSNIWNLGQTSGTNQVKWEYSKDGTVWSVFTTANQLHFLASNLATSTSQNVYFRLTLPTETSSGNAHSGTVTILAIEP